jgi:hypothetical protein
MKKRTSKKGRRRMDAALTNREYNVALKGAGVYCIVCSRRAGRYDAYCGPSNFANRRRQYRTWKHNRRTRWRE